MHWIKAFHIIAMVAWFAGLFYLPRLFVYHAQSTDRISIERFKIMEKRLYFAIMSPAALLTIGFGIWTLAYRLTPYMQMLWLHLKLTLVFILALYHIYLGFLLKSFANDRNTHSPKFYKIMNEIPTVLLVCIVILVVVKPFA
jgi:protoporphyrinogen IX oxidase